MYTPTWKEFEDKMSKGTPEEQVKAVDAFIEERNKETQASRKARLWEEDRKKDIAKQKPQYVQQRLKKEKEDHQTIIKSLKSIGNFDCNIKPAPGYILVEIKERENQTQSGILLAETEEEPNRGIVIATGDTLHIPENTVPCPVTVGDNILFKKFAGVETEVMNRRCRLMQFTDVLATLLYDQCNS